MNVGVGELRMKFRGLTEEPCFTGHDAVMLPFDTYYPWMEGGEHGPLLTDIHLRARVEVLRAAAAGVTVCFLYEDCFAHFTDPEELRRGSLGAMILGGLGLSPVPLLAPEDDLEVLAPQFSFYLRRFGIAESYLEAERPSVRLHPLCRTPAHLLTGVAADEGAGRILFLPGDPRNRFLEFFSVLGSALERFCLGKSSTGQYIFAAEHALLVKRAVIAAQHQQNQLRLDTFQRRRELLTLVAADPDRFLPEWFSTFLDIEWQPTTEAGCFHLSGGHRHDPAAAALMAVAVRSAGDALVALQEIRAQQVAEGSLARDATVFLHVTDEALRDVAGVMAFPLELYAAAREDDVLLLRPADLFRLLDHRDRFGGSIGLDDLRRIAASVAAPGPGATSALAPVRKELA